MGFVIAAVSKRLSVEKKDDIPQRQTTESFHKLSKDPEKLLAWVQREEAITEPSQDSFDMSVQARNMSRLLLQNPLKTIALVGEYGSGKSSILNMVDYYLKPENRAGLSQTNENDKDDFVDQEVDIIICRVDGWGFAEGSTAEHILECAVNELGRHVDVSGLRTIPGQYMAAMDSSGNVLLKIIAALATCWKSPLDILKRMDSVLIAIDKRLIIFLEDVDRNKNDAVFFNEIAALLDTLRKLEQVSFLLAIGQKYDAEEVLIKTAEHVENVPRLNRLDVINSLETFRSVCLEQSKEKLALLPEREEKDRIGWTRNAVIRYAAEIDEKMSDPIDAISELTNNPRVLKHALRKTLTAWEKLVGEIDFDDLLIVNVLKTVDERIFSFIDKNISPLKYLLNGRDEKGIGELKNTLQEEFQSATKDCRYDVEAAKELLRVLFPVLFSERSHDSLYKESMLTYQHVTSEGPTNYWERIKRGELYDNEIPDCEILRALRRWNEDFESKAFRNLEMVEAFSKDKRVYPKAQQFKKVISRDCLQSAGAKQFGITLKEYGYKASREVCPAVNQWFTLGPEQRDNQWQQWLFDEIKKALPISLQYATDLYHFWYSPERNQEGTLRAKVVEAAKKIYEKDPALLAKVLDPNYIWSGFEFIDNFMEKGSDGRFYLKQWSWLGERLIKAANENSQVIGVHTAAMLCIYPAYNREKGIEFNDEFQQQDLEQIFTGNNDAVMKLLLLEGVDIEKYDEQSKKVLYRAQAEAKKWLNQNSV